MVIDCSKCPEGSGCCGIIPFDKKLIEKHKDKFQVKPAEIREEGEAVIIGTDDLVCVFKNRKTRLCVIYDDRPYVCRLSGTKEGIKVSGLGLACPHFKPNGSEWSPGMKAKIMHVQRKNFKKLLRNAG